MATEIPIKIQFVKSLSTAQPSRIVAVKADGDTVFSLWVTDKTGIPYPLKDLQNNVIITNTDGNLQITSSSTNTNINLASSILATINSALQSGGNISELVNDVGYLVQSDIINYTNEDAQDAVGTILVDTTTIDFTYNDTTPSISADVKLNSIDATHLANNINVSKFTNDSGYITLADVDGTDLTYSSSLTDGTIISSTGSDAIIPLASIVNAGLISPQEKQNIASAIQLEDLANVATSGNYEDLNNIPTTFNPTPHTHPISDIVNLQTNLDLKQDNLVSGTSIKTLEGQSLLGSGNINLTKLDVGLDNVPNTDFTSAVAANTAKTTNQTHTGDATGATVLTLATVNSNVGSFGTASNVPQYTVNAKGLTTASANIPIQIAESQVINLVADLSNKQATLVSGTNIRTINGNTLLGATDLTIPVATDATTLAKGIVQLAGDLGGTADNPTTPTAIHKIGDEIKHGILTLSDGLKIVGNTTSTTATKVNVQENDGAVNTQTINTGFNKNIGLGGSDIVGATTLLNQYSTTPVDWTATAFNSGQVVFYGGKQWIAKMATVAGDVPAVSSKWEEITFEALANKTVIVDAIPTGGSNNAVSSNGVFDALATKAPISSVHNPVTLGTANGLSLSNQQLSLGLASSGVTGALSGTDWNNFNNKQNALAIVSDAEMQTGTENTKFTTALRIASWFTWIKTQAQTWAAKQTFTLAPRFSSTTASQFLKVDSNKDLASVSEASDAEMQAGTDNTKPTTALRIKNWFVWRLTQSFTFGSLTGIGDRVTQVDSTGLMTALLSVEEAIVTDVDVSNAITAGTYNIGNSFKTSITPASSKTFFVGQIYYNGVYKYEAVANNISQRFSAS